MFGLFKCKHPAKYLHPEKDSTEQDTEYPEYKAVTYHLYCMACNEPVKIKYARYVDQDK